MVRTDNNWAYFYKSSDGKYYATPPRIPKKEISNWMKTVKHPVTTVTNLREYYELARASIHGVNDYMVVAYGEQSIDMKEAAIEHWKSPFVQIDETVASRLQLEPGVYICRMYTKYDGDMDVNFQGDLKYIPYDPESGEFDDFLVKNGKPKMHYLDKFEKIFPLFEAVHNGSGRVVYILTSNIHGTSSRYLHMLQNVATLASKYPDITFAILPKDSIAGKMGVTR